MQTQVSVPSFDLVPMVQQTIHWAIDFWPTLVLWSKDFLSFLIVISFPLSLFFLIAIIYCVEKLKLIKKKDALKYDAPHVEPAFEEGVPQGNDSLTTRWAKVTGFLSSENQNDWKQAILEADIMLDEILTSLGYQGDSIGEKLKRAQPGDFKSIQDAWDAHKIRNDIAHGSDFQLAHHEANQAIQRYRKVFEEFYYI